eukprot:gene9425-244_t
MADAQARRETEEKLKNAPLSPPGWRTVSGPLPRVGIVVERMQQQGDFAHIEATFFSSQAVSSFARFPRSPAGPPSNVTPPAIMGMPAKAALSQDKDNLLRMDCIPSWLADDVSLDLTVSTLFGRAGPNPPVSPRISLQANWQGYWIDAASALRMDPGIIAACLSAPLKLSADAVIVLDPVNRSVIDTVASFAPADCDASLSHRVVYCTACVPIRWRSLLRFGLSVWHCLNGQGVLDGKKVFVGGNCTTSLMLMALGGLWPHIEWVTSMSYQAVSGAGAQHVAETLKQMGSVCAAVEDGLKTPRPDALSLMKTVDRCIRNEPGAPQPFPTDMFGAPIACSLLPYIDSEVPGTGGQSREEWKGMAEANKILGAPEGHTKVDGLCTRCEAAHMPVSFTWLILLHPTWAAHSVDCRVASLRCHSMAFTIKLKSSSAGISDKEVSANT